jgi:O-methyltransferase
MTEATAALHVALHSLAAFPEARRYALEELVAALFAQGRDGRLSKLFRQNVDVFSALPDAAFDEIYLAGVLATRTSPVPLRRRDRFLLLVRELDKTLALEGLVAECGCFRGLSSFLLCSRLKRSAPAFDGAGYRIFDSFRGLSEPGHEDSLAQAGASAPHANDVRAGRFAASLEEVRHALAAFPGVAYFPGWIPAAFPVDEARYRFVHIDVDLYQPTRDSLEYFWPRLVPGGRVVCDDYNWPGGRRSVDEFCAAHGVVAGVTSSQQAVIER